MVRQLLTFAKGSEGERVAVQPVHLVKEMRTIIGGTFPKNVKLETDVSPGLPTVIGDPTQIHQIFLNLCVNARDAMPDGGTITIGVEAVDVDAAFVSAVQGAKAGRYVCLTVSDTGEGIPPDVIDRIFDPFYTTKDPDKGTGLGLSTVLGIVKGHGGFVNVYSTPGEGATFKVYLPVHEGGEVEVDVAIPETPFRGSGETILVVDDERPIRTTARAVLGAMGFEVVTAIDGADGLVQAAQHRNVLAAVITDLHMPEMDGLAFTRLLRRVLPDLPVVIASGRLDDRTAASLASLNVARVLDKPYTQADLAECLRAVLAGDDERPSAGRPPR